eukprot:8902750-Karenia_brevis.AAC.1
MFDVKSDPGVRKYDLGENLTVATELESWTGGAESILHLVQDGETSAELHQCVLPPGEYHDELMKLWRE